MLENFRGDERTEPTKQKTRASELGNIILAAYVTRRPSRQAEEGNGEESGSGDFDQSYIEIDGAFASVTLRALPVQPSRAISYQYKIRSQNETTDRYTVFSSFKSPRIADHTSSAKVLKPLPRSENCRSSSLMAWPLPRMKWLVPALACEIAVCHSCEQWHRKLRHPAWRWETCDTSIPPGSLTLFQKLVQ